jgi:hypothetical protein
MSDEDEKKAFEEKLAEFMSENAALADLDITPQQQLFVELHQYYEWLRGAGFTPSESLEFLVIYLIRMLEATIANGGE